MVTGMHLIGRGLTDLETLCAVLNMPIPMTQNTYSNHAKALHAAAVRILQATSSKQEDLAPQPAQLIIAPYIQTCAAGVALHPFYQLKFVERKMATYNLERVSPRDRGCKQGCLHVDRIVACSALKHHGGCQAIITSCLTQGKIFCMTLWALKTRYCSANALF